ncbi:MAG: cysteine desulfurase [Candidatus Thermoplasmatota archaeon]|jgi:cysteine desulfurase/selenocysteine lyase|nr:cysteine desulfurase [Candidatus Sysuiplasma jiujiangense]MBX8638920.1 cysteine desulfurase [Candidatus Sysuiplasma jiujiangense]MCL4318038.1 cysteine desulfurase [Candidatus Thermoplasmatota archaeon]MCL5253501.1 cysteine desulfurase [Candidatus Thermoplasmatota archaeon]
MKLPETLGDVSPLIGDFPIFSERREKLIYLDSAATSQRPFQVIDAVSSFERMHNANVHRGIYPLGEEATEFYENARGKVAGFLHAGSPDEIIFLRGTTEAINVLALSLGIWKLKPGDEVLTTVMEHHSNVVPWQMLAWRGIRLKFADIDSEGRLDMEDFRAKLTDRTKVVSVAQVSNVLGTVNPVREIADLAHDNSSLLIVDGAQSAPHMPVDVEKLDCDFFALSGHKMLAPTGIGALYGKSEHLRAIEPAFGGGEMISEVHQNSCSWNVPPYKFEAGTPNISGAVGLGAAVDYLNSIGMENVEKYDKLLLSYALSRLSERNDIEIYGPKDVEERSGVIAFNINGIHGHDTAEILGRQGVSIRSGHHCAQPLMDRLNISSASRASFYLYNGRKDIDALAEALDTVRKVFA